MSTTAPAQDLRSLLAARWQVPALILSIALLGTGVPRLIPPKTSLSIEEARAHVNALSAAARHQEAQTFVIEWMGHGEHSPAHLAEAHRLLGETLVRSESVRRVDRRTLGQIAIAHFRKAVEGGVELRPDDRLRLADAFTWMGDLNSAAAELRRAIQQDAPRRDWLRRRLADWIESGRLRADRPEYEALVASILNDNEAHPSNLMWALSRTVSRLLDDGNVEAASALLEQKLAASGGADMAEARFLQASILTARGALNEAEAILRGLLNVGAPRDELWGRTTMLLGELSQRDDRPQEALGYFDEVLNAFRSGPLHEAGLLRRAESLVALDRFGAAADALERVVSITATGGTTGRLDRGAIRAFLRTSAAMLETRRLDGFQAEALRYLEMCERLQPLESGPDAVFLAERIASLHVELAKQAGNSAGAARHHVAAARAFLRRAALDPNTLTTGPAAMLSAVEQFESGGRLDEAIATLKSFLRNYSQNPFEPAVRLRLGQLYQKKEKRRDAVDAYARLMVAHGRTVEATKAVAPLATCLMELGDEERAYAERLLLRFLDQPPGTEAVVTPQAPEYRNALQVLARLYREQRRHEEAISRLEDALALYPDDPDVAEMRFDLAASYFASSLALRDALEQTATTRPAAPLRDADARDRMRRAITLFGQVIATLAGANADQLTSLEQAHLRAAYLYRADGWFELGRYRDAASAYAEAIWRFEGEAASLTAAIQLVHCHQRLGELDEARVALERARWLLRKIPENAFSAQAGMPDRAYWESCLTALGRSGLVS